MLDFDVAPHRSEHLAPVAETAEYVAEYFRKRLPELHVQERVQDRVERRVEPQQPEGDLIHRFLDAILAHGLDECEQCVRRLFKHKIDLLNLAKYLKI